MTQATARDDGYWDFLGHLEETAAVSALKLATQAGDTLLGEIQRAPIFSFGAFEVDFRQDIWDFTAITELNIPNGALRISFKRSPLKDAYKLYLIESILWQRAKVQSLISQTETAARALDSIGLDRRSLARWTAEDAADYLKGIETATSPANVATYARALLNFISFFDRAFGKITDPDLSPTLKAILHDSEVARRRDKCVPPIPDEYLVPLVRMLERVMSDPEEQKAHRITAAVGLLFSQTGLRNSELLGANSGCLSISKGIAGEPDLAYLNYGTFKGEHGDNRARPARTFINPIALSACLWLEENCAEHRSGIGSPALVVYPRQRKRYCDQATFTSNFKNLIVAHHGEIPCVNTQGVFPELSCASAGSMTKKENERRGLGSDDTIVYPTIHQFCSTVATKLREEGVDMHYIREHMNHMDEDTSSGYIHSERKVELESSELVYRAVFEDGAKLLGSHADDFMTKVEAFKDELAGSVAEDMDALIAGVSDRFPLRRIVGGVCTRCGNVIPCSKSDEADAILCAFGVCPNQCHMYFMAGETLSSANSHMRLVDWNLEHGHVKAAANELRKVQNVLKERLVPEMEGLAEQIMLHGRAHVLKRFPDLADIIDNMNEINERTQIWLERKI